MLDTAGALANAAASPGLARDRVKPRVCFLWMQPSGYMAACWRALSETDAVELLVVAEANSPPQPFDPAIMRGIKSTILPRSQLNDHARLQGFVRDFAPTVIVLCGWSLQSYISLVFSKAFRDIPVILTSDTPVLFNWRQRLGPLRIGRLLRRASLFIVPGERALQLLRWWRVPLEKIRTGLYGFDGEALNEAYRIRSQSPEWPQQFLFVGRYVASKGIDVLVSAYSRYRTTTASPWPLVTCGSGELKHLLACEGIIDLGFLQPDDVRDQLTQSGCLIMPSRHDPWGVAIAEAAASGLPVIATTACGCTAEIIRDRFNGRAVSAGDEVALAESLSWMHAAGDKLATMGERGRVLGGAYSARNWAARWLGFCHELNPDLQSCG